MRKIETIATVTAEGILTLTVPADVPVGPHTVIVEIDERLATPEQPDATDWPTFVQETAGAWRGARWPRSAPSM